MNQKMKRKLRERAATMMDGSAFNANAKLRYMASDFPGTVFESLARHTAAILIHP